MNSPIRLPDYPALIAYLEQAGLGLSEISGRLGIDRRTLSAIKNERQRVDTTGLVLLRLFLDETDKNVPYLGDHHGIVPG